MARAARNTKSPKPGSRRKAAKHAKALRDDDDLHEDNAICACDCVFDDTEATPDAQLPAARGG